MQRFKNTKEANRLARYMADEITFAIYNRCPGTDEWEMLGRHIDELQEAIEYINENEK